MRHFVFVHHEKGRLYTCTLCKLLCITEKFVEFKNVTRDCKYMHSFIKNNQRSQYLQYLFIKSSRWPVTVVPSAVVGTLYGVWVAVQLPIATEAELPSVD